MRSLIYYISRWNSTNMSYLVKNCLSALFIFLLTCYAVKDGVFETYGDTKSCLFAVLMCCIWSGTFNSVALFFSESDYITDDLNKFLSVRVYVLANLLIQLFLCALEALVCTVVFKVFYDYEASDILFANRSVDYCITFFLVLISSDMLGFLVGMLVKNITSAMTIIPIILISQFLFSGCLFEVGGILKNVATFTTARWGFAALGTISDLNSYLPAGTENNLFDYTGANVVRCWGQLGILGVICFFGAGILLYFKISSNHR